MFPIILIYNKEISFYCSISYFSPPLHCLLHAMHVHLIFCYYFAIIFDPPGGSGWIISVGDYADNSFAAFGSSDPREVRLKL